MRDPGWNITSYRISPRYSAISDHRTLNSRLHTTSNRDAIKFSSLTTRLIILFTVLFAFLEITLYRNIVLASYGLFAIGIAVLFFNPRWGFFYYLVVNLLSTDTPFTFSTTGFSSVHITKIAGLTIETLWTVLMLLAFISYTLLGKYRLRKKHLLRIDRLLIFMGILFGIEAILGLRHSGINIPVFISDASYYINMAIAYLAVRLTCRDKRSLRTLLAVLVACLIVRAGAGLLYFIVGIGEQAGANYRAVTDSIRNIFPLLVLLGMAYYARSSTFRRDRVVGRVLLFGGALGAFNVLNYASRGNILMTFVGIAVLIVLSRYSSQQQHSVFGALKSFLKVVVFAVIIIGFALWFMDSVRPGSLDYLEWKLNSFLDISYDRGLSSAATRWLEFKNIVPYLWHRGNILWGEGLGGWFVDKYYPFAEWLLGGSAYPDDWILAGRLYKPHGTQLVILLKMGIVGLVIYYGILMAIFINGIKILRRCHDPFFRIILLAVLSFLPLLLYKNFISKMQIFMGVAIGILAVIQSFNLRRQNGDVIEDARAVS
jgi:hypothetical protein